MTTSDRTPDPDQGPERAPSVAEIAALTRRLRELSTAGRSADPAARAAFLADKQALLARIDPARIDPGVVDHGPPVELADDAADEDPAAVDAGWSR